MSAAVKLSSALPGDPNINGLDVQAADLIANPKDLRVAITWYDASKVVTNTDDGTEVPYVRIRRFEPIGKVADVSPALQKTLQKAIEDRTGEPALPFDTAEPYEVEAE
ncbi:hypothetical protein [Microlunatus parietis]|uniref:Uncharacterized protein n=1 Tax=Microlunatus parietis TaxID=682979 RepID=A0A7Y9I267_9ACTN|nr:hypothetical protein [Microlunatus parietis]NYE68883.1 hypothetical protein [Microlunatus parietis]